MVNGWGAMMDAPVEDLPAQVAAVAGVHPNRVFLQEVGGAARTYGDLADAACSWARALKRVGIGLGDTVAVLAPTGADAIEVWMGIARAGGIEVPVNTALRGRLLHHVLTDSGASVLVAHERWLERLTDLPPGLAEQLDLIVVLGRGAAIPNDIGGVRCVAAGELRQAAQHDLDPARRLSRTDIASVIFTSGTTGASKGVDVSWAQMYATAHGSMPPSEPDESDVYYSPLPLFHIGGKFAVLRQAFQASTVVLRDGFSTSAFWSDIARYNCTTTLLLGAVANFLYRQPPGPDDAGTPLRQVIMIPLIPELDDFRRRFGVRVTTTFNMTELSAPLNSGWEPANTRTAGRVRPGYHCRVVDETGQDVPPGVVGELLVRADDRAVLSAGYRNRPEATEEAWRDGWFHTGDAFFYDENGDYYFADRLKDTIRRRGENISSIELELEVLAHDDVLECAAVAVPSEWGEDEVKVVVVPKAGRRITAPQLVDFLVPRVADFMVPRYVEIADSLPKTETQKVQKNRLREAGINAATWDRRAAQVAGSPGRAD
jgi:crotonobetaine/carnitine-CoA ligase